MRNRTFILSVVTAVLIAASGFQAGAAQVPASAEVQAQAAAMTLSSEDLPTGFTLTGETFLPLPDATQVPGATAHYVSQYTNLDNGQQIRSYVYLFEDDAAATAGMDVIEGDEPSTLTDAAAEVGSGKAELTTGTYESLDGTVIGTADVTFIRGNVVAGVAVDGADETVPDSKLATDLAKRADARVQQVQAGEFAIDLALPGLLVPITDNATVIQAGYLSAGESEAIYGTQGSALTSLTGTYIQTVAFGDEGAVPRVTLGVSTFATPEEAAAVVEQADLIFKPLADQEKVDGAAVEGADSAVAYRYTSRDGSIAEKESYRIIFAQGTAVTVVDVQGAQDSATAEAAANAIAGPQVTCQTGGECVKPAAPGVIPG